ncbi:hypothetical protein AB0F73_10220 [Micromonospora purpureochromogenes]|uniref:hypothetical protein n=1 Tax=Micromonospora purpureochromogenes TaxID=47872 RepID=UPI0033F98765
MGYATVIAHGPWTDAASVTASLIAAAIAAGLVYGLWRGNPLAQGVVVLAMAGNLIFGLLEHAGIGWLRAVNMVAALIIALLLLHCVSITDTPRPRSGPTASPRYETRPSRPSGQ